MGSNGMYWIVMVQIGKTFFLFCKPQGYDSVRGGPWFWVGRLILYI